jgi:hypothetical protein
MVPLLSFGPARDALKDRSNALRGTTADGHCRPAMTPPLTDGTTPVMKLEATKDTSAVIAALLRRLRPFDHLVHSGEDRKEIAGSTRIFSDLTGDRLRGTYEER